MSKAVVGVRWGSPVGTGGAKRGEKFLPVGNNGKRDKTRGNVA